MADSADNTLPVIFPNAPVLASDRTGWKNICFAHFRQPPCEVPDHVSSKHVICMNVGKPVQLQQAIDGRHEAVDSVPGDLGIYPAHLSQQFSWAEEVEFFNVFLEPAFLARVGYEMFGKEHLELIPHLTTLFDPLILQMGFALKKSLEIDGIHSNLYADSMAYALVVHLLARYSTRAPQPQISTTGLTPQQRKQIVDYMHANLERNISLAELAEILHLSPHYFAHLFKQSMGIPPHRYLIHCRVERAKQLLRLNHLSIAAVAQAVGFASQGHFTYHFKRFVGVTPKVFLNQSQEH